VNVILVILGCVLDEEGAHKWWLLRGLGLLRPCRDCCALYALLRAEFFLLC
jgi:hypothetical protein